MWPDAALSLEAPPARAKSCEGVCSHLQTASVHSTRSLQWLGRLAHGKGDEEFHCRCRGMHPADVPGLIELQGVSVVDLCIINSTNVVDGGCHTISCDAEALTGLIGYRSACAVHVERRDTWRSRCGAPRARIFHLCFVMLVVLTVSHGLLQDSEVAVAVGGSSSMGEGVLVSVAVGKFVSQSHHGWNRCTNTSTGSP